jgi:hypothetical protein
LKSIPQQLACRRRRPEELFSASGATTELLEKKEKVKMVNNLAGRFKDQRWLVAHNAWNTEDIPNQCKTITELLDYGVRGLAFDIYGDDEPSLHLQHRHANPASSTKWSKIRDELKTWLDKNKSDVVTLFFESYLTGPKPGQPSSGTALAALDTSLQGITCYKSGRVVQEAAMHTPGKNLSDLIAKNHRLFAFIEKEPDEGKQSIFPVMTASFAENVYGDESLKIPSWVNLRDGSAYANPLTFMNHFGDAPSGSEWDRNDPGLIEKHAEDFLFRFGGRYPNFISLDYINWDRQNAGPIKAMRNLLSQKDLGVTSFNWSLANTFDDLEIEIDNNVKISSLSVDTEQGRGIVKIHAVRSSSQPGIKEIQLVNKPGYGVVNMRIKKGPSLSWGKWLTPFETLDDQKDPNLATHQIPGDLMSICCRTSSGYGVVDFAAAYRK